MVYDSLVGGSSTGEIEGESGCEGSPGREDEAAESRNLILGSAPPHRNLIGHVFDLMLRHFGDQFGENHGRCDRIHGEGARPTGPTRRTYLSTQRPCRACDGVPEPDKVEAEPALEPVLQVSDEKSGKPLLFIAAISALLVAGGVADIESVTNAQRAAVTGLTTIEAPKLKPYMSGADPAKYPFPAKPPPEYFQPFYDQQQAQ